MQVLIPNTGMMPVFVKDRGIKTPINGHIAISGLQDLSALIEFMGTQRFVCCDDPKPSENEEGILDFFITTTPDDDSFDSRTLRVTGPNASPDTKLWMDAVVTCLREHFKMPLVEPLKRRSILRKH